MVNFSVEGVGFSDFHFHIIYQQFLKAIETRELFSSRHKILEIVKFVITEKKHCYKGVFPKFLFAPIMDERVLSFLVGSWYLRVKKIFCFILKQVLDGYG